MPRRRIQIDFSLTENGQYTINEDVARLGISWDWLLRELHSLSDDDILDLFEEDKDATPGPEGTWGLLELDPYWLISQLLYIRPSRLGGSAGHGWLKITRIYRRQGADAAVAEMRRLEELAERRSLSERDREP